jgi:hypothetical protein
MCKEIRQSTHVEYDREPVPPDIIFLVGTATSAAEYGRAASDRAEAQPASAVRLKRLRAFGSSSRLRKRIDFGVTSTSSSSAI